MGETATKLWSFFIDRGGTFTDCIGLSPDSEVRVTKVLSSDEAPLEGIRKLLNLQSDAPIPPCHVRMGTTVATNALLEQKGAKTALAITRGFEDALILGTQARPDLFALEIEAPKSLAQATIALDVRIGPNGAEIKAPACGLKPWDTSSLREEFRKLVRAGFGSLAVLVLGGYLQGESEIQVSIIAREAGFRHVSVSHEVAPEQGLVARGSTTVVDAYLTPLIQDYVQHLVDHLPGSQLLIMQSSGGLVQAHQFRGRDAVMSGPAGGAVALAGIARAAGVEQVIGFDMGGTSTDTCRVAEEPERIYEAEVAGIQLRATMIDIHTVAAGGGSVCRREGDRLTVGPESTRAVPGPLCYGHSSATQIAITDVNLVLGRLRPERFPFALDKLRAERAIQAVGDSFPEPKSLEEVAEGFLEVANEKMAHALRKVSVARGHDVREHALVVFGGAGGQHAAALAKSLDIDVVLFPPFSGVLSAYGMALAKVEHYGVHNASQSSLDDGVDLEQRFRALEQKGEAKLRSQGFRAEQIDYKRRIDLRYKGTENYLSISADDLSGDRLRHSFESLHQKTFGYIQDRPIEAVNVRVASRGQSTPPTLEEPPDLGQELEEFEAEVYVNGQWRKVPAIPREAMVWGRSVNGPSLVLEATGTIFVESGFRLEGGDILRMVRTKPTPIYNERANGVAKRQYLHPDPIRLEVYNHRFMAIAEQMGEVLRKTALSVNIRERLDFSCALFDGEGALIANAPHIPVHLGAMSESIRGILKQHAVKPGDVYVTNDPAQGGTHLPDVTVVTPIFSDEGRLAFFSASRGHHEDIGGITPGSMPPFSTSLDEEGVILRGLRLVSKGMFQARMIEDVLSEGLYPARDPKRNLADLEAQVAANHAGSQLIRDLVTREGEDEVQAYMRFVREDAASRVRAALAELGLAPRRFEDSLDDGTAIQCEVRPKDGGLVVDFSGSGPAVSGNLNAPRSIAVSATLYVMRALVGASIPLNSGCLDPIELIVPPESILDPPHGAAVAGGNVETSQRVVDVLLGALHRAAASQGTMNNLSFGNASFGYYETIAGGAGATAKGPGRSGVHTHMTNTRITDPEVLETRFPVRVLRFALRQGSGGSGAQRGGDGVVRELEFLEPVSLSILSERRTRAPFGLAGGGSGAVGQNWIDAIPVPAKVLRQLASGTRVTIETPGGGGWGLVFPGGSGA